MSNVFILGPLYINKLSFLLTSKGDFGVKTTPQTVMQIDPWGSNHFCRINMNKRPGLPLIRGHLINGKIVK